MIPKSVVKVQPNPLVPGDTGGWTVVYDLPPGVSGVPLYRVPTQTVSTVSVPATAASPAVISSSADIMQLEGNWDAAARSIENYTGNAEYTFTTSNCAGIATGISYPTSDIGVGYQEIDYAFYVTRNHWFVYEKGVSKTSGTQTPGTTVFKIKRIGNLITYYIDSTLVYTSTVAFSGNEFIIDASLFLADDAIIDAAVTTLSVGSGGGGGSGIHFVGGGSSGYTSYILGGAGIRFTGLGSGRGYGVRGGPGIRFTGRGTSGWAGGLGYGGGSGIRFTGRGTSGFERPIVSLGGGVGLTFVGRGTGYYLGRGVGGGNGIKFNGHGTSGWPGGLGYGGGAGVYLVGGGTSGWEVTENYSFINIPKIRLDWTTEGEDALVLNQNIAYVGINWSPEENTYNLNIPNIWIQCTLNDYDSLTLSANISFGIESNLYSLNIVGPTISTNLDAETISGNKIGYLCNLHYDDGPEVTKLVGGWADFIRIIRIGNNTYGVKNNGLYKIGGNTFNGQEISSSFTTTPNMFGYEYMKRCRAFYGGFSSAVYITPIIGDVEYGEFKTFRGKNNQWIAKIPQGLRDQFWSFKIQNIDGQRMKVTWMEPQFENLFRRVA